MIPAWKQFATEVTVLIAAISPLYYFLMQIIRWERNAALDRREMKSDIEHLKDQVNDLQNWRSANSGLRLP